MSRAPMLTLTLKPTDVAHTSHAHKLRSAAVVTLSSTYGLGLFVFPVVRTQYASNPRLVGCTSTSIHLHPQTRRLDGFVTQDPFSGCGLPDFNLIIGRPTFAPRARVESSSRIFLPSGPPACLPTYLALSETRHSARGPPGHLKAFQFTVPIVLVLLTV